MFPKSLFWKLLTFTFIGTVCALLLIWLFIPSEPDVPTLPDELLILAQAKEENARTDEIWQYNTDHAESLLPDPEANDKLAAIARQELGKGQFNQACLTVAKIPVPALRDELYDEIFNAACGSCGTISWAVLAIREMGNRAKASQMTEKILDKWNACKREVSL